MVGGGGSPESYGVGSLPSSLAGWMEAEREREPCARTQQCSTVPYRTTCLSVLLREQNRTLHRHGGIHGWAIRVHHPQPHADSRRLRMSRTRGTDRPSRSPPARLGFLPEIPKRARRGRCEVTTTQWRVPHPLRLRNQTARNFPRGRPATSTTTKPHDKSQDSPSEPPKTDDFSRPHGPEQAIPSRGLPEENMNPLKNACISTSHKAD